VCVKPCYHTRAEDRHSQLPRCSGAQMQFNMIDTEILRAAQRNPGAYRDLVVRISGYSALFTELSPRAQEEIIGRMEYCA
jgi:pyruvate-formate lyase